jgi:hypothetical protein
MHCGKPLPFKAISPLAATAVVATPRFGCRRRPCSTQMYSRRSQSSYPKLLFIFPRNLQRSILPTVSHIPHATKDDDSIADAQLASATEAFLPEVWPDFSKKTVDPDIEEKFFNRKKGYELITDHLKEKPKAALLLLGPKNSGKSVSPQLKVEYQHIHWFWQIYIVQLSDPLQSVISKPNLSAGIN